MRCKNGNDSFWMDQEIRETYSKKCSWWQYTFTFPFFQLISHSLLSCFFFLHPIAQPFLKFMDFSYLFSINFSSIQFGPEQLQQTRFK